MKAPARPETAASTEATDRTASGPALRSMPREVAAGAMVGFIALPFCVSAGVVAYEPLGPSYVAVGAAAGILCAVAGGITSTLARASSFVPSVPSSTMALIQASFVAGLATRFGPESAAALLPLAALGAGLCQVLIAWSGLARAVKFTPYPVLAGFVTGLAILIFVQQLLRLFGAPNVASLGHALATLDLGSAAMPAFGIALAFAIFNIEKRAPSWPSMLIGLVGGTVLYHLLTALFPDLDLGHTVGAVSLVDASLGLRIRREQLVALLSDSAAVQSLILASLTLGVLGTLDVAFGMRTAQNLDGAVELAPKRNLAGQGLANAVASLAGGLTVTTSLSFARTIFQSGGRTRVSTISVSLVLLLAVVAAPQLIALLPTAVLSAVLLSIAVRLWDRWCIELVRSILNAPDRDAAVRARRNAGIVGAVAVATVLGQPAVGALMGVALACLVFIIEMSRPVVRRQLDGSRIFSKRIRSQHDLARLVRAGSTTVLLELQGILFFGNADDLASRVRQIEGATRRIILDFGRITDVDTSGATILSQIAQRCRQTGHRLILAGIDPKFAVLMPGLAAGLDGVGIAPDVDAALELAENELIAAERADGEVDDRALALSETDFAGGLSARELALLSQHVSRAAYPAGEALCRAGEPADRLWLLTRGSVSVRLPGRRTTRRIAGLGPGTSVGELGLLDRRPRSADVVADEPVEAWVMTADAFDRILREEPQLGQSLLATIARMTAQRLRVTSEELMLADV